MKSLSWAMGVFLGATLLAESPMSKPNAAESVNPLNAVSETAQKISTKTVFPEIRLSNGQVLSDARFLNASSMAASFAIDKTIRSVPYSLLPKDITASALEYYREHGKILENHIAETQALSLASAATRDADAEHRRKLENQNQENVVQQSQEADTAAKRTAQIRDLALSSANDYFKHQWKPGNDSILITAVDITLEDIDPRAGWENQWDVKGEAYIQYYISSGRSFSSSNVKFSAVLKESGSFPRFEPTLF